MRKLILAAAVFLVSCGNTPTSLPTQPLPRHEVEINFLVSGADTGFIYNDSIYIGKVAPGATVFIQVLDSSTLCIDYLRMGIKKETCTQITAIFKRWIVN